MSFSRVDVPARPLLKWAGGKPQHYPAAFDRHVEPFVGSGAVFFDLYAAGRLHGRCARLVDLNPDLRRSHRLLPRGAG